MVWPTYNQKKKKVNKLNVLAQSRVLSSAYKGPKQEDAKHVEEIMRRTKQLELCGQGERSRR